MSPLLMELFPEEVRAYRTTMVRVAYVEFYA
jgi:hypothetical protein